MKILKKMNSHENMLLQMKLGGKGWLGISYVAMIGLAVITIFPIFWLLSSSLKTTQDLAQNPWGLPQTLHFANYYNAWINSSLLKYIFNSLIVTLIAVFLTIACSSTLAYALSRTQFKFKKSIYYFVIAGMMVPVHSLVIPIYLNTQALGIQDNLLVLAFIYAAFRIPFSVFILEGFLASIPKEMEECASIDGASTWGTFLNIIFPLVRDGVITISILAMMSSWNELLVSSLVIKSPDLKTLTVGIRTFVTDTSIEQTMLFAGLFIACLPSLVLYAFAQEKMIKGMTAGAVKG